MPEPIVTQPGFGGTDITKQEGPLRTGLIPKKVTFPLDKDIFYTDQLKAASRSFRVGIKPRLNVRVRQKEEVLAAGGVFNIFSRGHNNGSI